MRIRPTWHEIYIETANVISKRATCNRANIGAVIVKNNAILSTGYNGSPSGWPHCFDVGCYMLNSSCIRTIHAELNSILNAAKLGNSVNGATIYVTHCPCFRCAMHIANVGIKQVIYKNSYKEDDDARTTKQLEDSGINVLQYKEGQQTLY